MWDGSQVARNDREATVLVPNRYCMLCDPIISSGRCMYTDTYSINKNICDIYIATYWISAIVRVSVLSKVMLS